MARRRSRSSLDFVDTTFTYFETEEPDELPELAQPAGDDESVTGCA